LALAKDMKKKKDNNSWYRDAREKDKQRDREQKAAISALEDQLTATQDSLERWKTWGTNTSNAKIALDKEKKDLKHWQEEDDKKINTLKNAVEDRKERHNRVQKDVSMWKSSAAAKAVLIEDLREALNKQKRDFTHERKEMKKKEDKLIASHDTRVKDLQKEIDEKKKEAEALGR
jgi:chromosome segregation ATPase